MPTCAGQPFQRLNAIVKGRRAVSADTALLLEALTRWDAEIWLRLQAKWDLWHAAHTRPLTHKERLLGRGSCREQPREPPGRVAGLRPPAIRAPSILQMM